MPRPAPASSGRCPSTPLTPRPRKASRAFQRPSRVSPVRLANKSHVAEVGADAEAELGGAVAGGPVDEEGFAEEESAWDTAWADVVVAFGGEVDGATPEAGVEADLGIVAKHKEFVGAEFHDVPGRTPPGFGGRGVVGVEVGAGSVEVVDVFGQAEVLDRAGLVCGDDADDGFKCGRARLAVLGKEGDRVGRVQVVVGGDDFAAVNAN